MARPRDPLRGGTRIALLMGNEIPVRVLGFSDNPSLHDHLYVRRLYAPEEGDVLVHRSRILSPDKSRQLLKQWRREHGPPPTHTT